MYTIVPGLYMAMNSAAIRRAPVPRGPSVLAREAESIAEKAEEDEELIRRTSRNEGSTQQEWLEEEEEEQQQQQKQQQK